MATHKRKGDGKNAKSLLQYHQKMAEDHISIYFMASQSFDKAILTLSIASLGFTFAYLQVHQGALSKVCMLFVSWALFVLTVLLILFTYIVLE